MYSLRHLEFERRKDETSLLRNQVVFERFLIMRGKKDCVTEQQEEVLPT